MSEEQPDRSSIFQEAQSLADEDRVGEALDLIQPYLEDKELEFESAEMAVISNVLVEKITRFILCFKFMNIFLFYIFSSSRVFLLNQKTLL